MQGVDLQDYANRLIERYSNLALRHRTADCDDGSQKLPQRMLDSSLHLAYDSKFDCWRWASRVDALCRWC
ncbi:MAG: hypothetical protein ACLRP3_11625 [Escherichia sp.]